MAHLLIIELPGGNDFDLIQAALDRGDVFTFLTAQLSHYQAQLEVWAKVALAREIIHVPSFESATLAQAVVAVHQRQPVHAVLCLVDIRIIEAARLAKLLGLRHISEAAATLLRDKFNVRTRLAEHGIAQVPFALATSNDTLKLAVEQLGLPVLIKPSDGYGSQNIVALQYPEDLDPLLSPLDDMLPCHADYGLGVRANDRLLVERFMTGTVIGCDTFSANGQHQLLGINEKRFFEPPSFAILGGCFMPYRAAFDAIARYVFSILDALEFNWGAAHVELMLTQQGPLLIEVNPRLVGAKIGRLISHALGRSVHTDLIALHVDGTLPTSELQHAEQQNTVAVTRWMVSEQSGTLKRVVLPNWQDPRIRGVEVLKKAGDTVRAPFDNADRLGYVMVCSSSRAEAEDLADRYVADTTVMLAPA